MIDPVGRGRIALVHREDLFGATGLVGSITLTSSVQASGLGQQAIETPCIGVCVLDASIGICRGCGRTRDEIGLWTRLSVDERRKIMAGLAGRLRTAGGTG